MKEQGTRLNKYLAACGVDSRRGCDDLILHGHVEVNGQPCIIPGTKIVDGDHVRIDGKRVTMLRSTTILLNKPRGLVCTREDEFQRGTIYALLVPSLQHLHHVGRLDADSEGLLILTNDGDLTHHLMHPNNKVEKEYLVTSNQPYTQEHLDLFLSGVFTKEGKLSAKSLRRQSARRLSIVLDQGAKRQIRVMHDALGYQVTKLVRVRIGMLWGGDLEVGRYRLLKPDEIQKAMTNPDTPAPKSAVRKVATKKAPATKIAKVFAKKNATKKDSDYNSPRPSAKKISRRSSPTDRGPSRDAPRSAKGKAGPRSPRRSS